ncbi:MAG TPA: hypothetical protein PJ994_10880, partial [Tepidiformaceae bacterium]|nr:hypothetical protein [Tepidiformaceae bacterium]
MAESSGIRFVEVLTTASAVANYLGVADVTAKHVLAALAILREEATLEDLGRPLSPMLRRGAPGSEPAVRGFAQRWYRALSENPHAELSEPQVEAMIAELRSIAM